MRWEFFRIAVIFSWLFIVANSAVGMPLHCPEYRIDLNDLTLHEGEQLLRDLGPDGLIYSVALVDSKITNIGLDKHSGIINYTAKKAHEGINTFVLLAINGSCITSKLVALAVIAKPEINNFYPLAKDLQMDEGDSMSFGVILENHYTYSWHLDGSLEHTGRQFVYKPDYYSSGNRTLRLTASSNGLGTYIEWNIKVRDVNRHPMQIYLLPDASMFADDYSEPYNLHNFFVDPDGDELTFTYRFMREAHARTDDPYMNLEITSGIVGLTSLKGFTGLKTLRFTATDSAGLSVSSNNVLIGVREKTQYCGDGICFQETCETCPQDCGKCDECMEDWVCSEWGNCIFGQLQVRNCMDLSNCSNPKGMPQVTRSCPYNCHDGIQNQDETGVDCGGVCGPCPSCDDGIKNGDETDVDCGGSCKPCQPGQACLRHLDCSSLVCNGFCQEPSCFDNTRNQGELGIDCGPVCGNLCPSCDDWIKNQDETGIDCGGSCQPCPTCDDGIQNCHKMPGGVLLCEERANCGGPCRPCTFRELHGKSKFVFFLLIFAAVLFSALVIFLENRYGFHAKFLSARSLVFLSRLSSWMYYKHPKHTQDIEDVITELRMLDTSQNMDVKYIEVMHSFFGMFKLGNAFSNEQLYFKLKDIRMPEDARKALMIVYSRFIEYSGRKYKTHVEAHVLINEAVCVLEHIKGFV